MRDVRGDVRLFPLHWATLHYIATLLHCTRLHWATNTLGYITLQLHWATFGYIWLQLHRGEKHWEPDPPDQDD